MSDEIFARFREKLYRLSSCLLRAFAEAKPYLVEEHTRTQMKAYEDKVTFYLELRNMIGKASGDFVDLKAYEPDMRSMIDNYLTASDAVKIGQFQDLTLLDFVAEEGKPFTSNTGTGHKEGRQKRLKITCVGKLLKDVL